MSHPIREILAQAGYQLMEAGEYWRTTAKFRGGKTSTSIAINRRTGRWKDFAMDSFWQSPETLVKLVKGEHVDFSNYEPLPEREKIEVQRIYPPEILKRLLPHFNLFLERGISRETLLLFQAGMAHSAKLNKRICFPVYDRHKRIVGFAGRWFKETPFGEAPKWKLQGDKRTWLYPCHLNEELIRDKKELIIVESIGDLLALWEAGIKNVVCVFGTAISAKQLSYVIGLDPNKIIIATNNDSRNDAGQKAAFKISVKLKKHFNDERILIQLPTLNDFGMMNSAEIQDWYAKCP